MEWVGTTKISLHAWKRGIRKEKLKIYEQGNTGEMFMSRKLVDEVRKKQNEICRMEDSVKLQTA